MNEGFNRMKFYEIAERNGNTVKIVGGEIPTTQQNGGGRLGTRTTSTPSPILIKTLKTL